jgi:integrase
MASVYKKKRKVRHPATGGITVQRSEKWWMKFRDGRGMICRRPGFTDKTATLRWAVQLEREAQLEQAGQHDPFKKHRRRPLLEHLADFEQSLRAKNDTDEHVAVIQARIKRVLSKCEFALLSDLSASALANCLSALRQEGMSVQTSNHYLRAIKQFARWMVQDRRMAENPLAHLATLNVEVDRRRRRRALTTNEFDRLVAAAQNGPPVMRLSGPDRAILYIIAGYTGYRRGEIGSITATSFDFDADPPTLTVEAGHSKRRRTDVIPLRPDFAERIWHWIDGRQTGAGQPLFHVDMRRTADMIKADLKRAEIPYVDEHGRYADFHALRHTFVSNLGKAGVPPKVAQSLARHSDINLTMNVYSHLELEEQLQAVKNLPPLPTGKTSAAVVPPVVPFGAQNGAGRLSPKSSGLTSVGTQTHQDRRTKPMRKACPKASDIQKIDAECHSMSSRDAEEEKRRGRDSNPGYPCGHTGFRDQHNRPLCHLSGWPHRRSDHTERRDRLPDIYEHRIVRGASRS